MTRITLALQDRDDNRIVYRVLADNRVVGTAVELADDRIAPWRLTLRGCCANLRRSSTMVMAQTIRHFALQCPEAFAPPPSSATAWVPADPAPDAVAAELRERRVHVVRAPMPDVSAIATVPAANRGRGV